MLTVWSGLAQGVANVELMLKRFRSGSDSTLGVLLIDGVFACFTCEDEFRVVKVAGETRIPAGRYEIKLRTDSPMAKRYAEKYPGHKGMLWLQDVPGFTYAYMHIGNTDDDTEGCVLVGQSAHSTETGGFVGHSGPAYRQYYPVIVGALERGDRVWITVEDQL